MLKTLYHGSDHILEHPVFGEGKVHNDYGLGFYCTESISMAKEWGVSLHRDGYANIYRLEDDGLQVLDLNAPEFCILHWLAILLENREFDIPSGLALEAKDYLTAHFRPDYKPYDIIVGYRADDSYFSFAQDFLNGTISYRQLSNAMHLGKLGTQVVLKSPLAFDRLQYGGYELANANDWYSKKLQRDRAARRQYFSVERNRRQKGDLYIAQIIDEEMTTDDLRLR